MEIRQAKQNEELPKCQPSVTVKLKGRDAPISFVLDTYSFTEGSRGGKVCQPPVLLCIETRITAAAIQRARHKTEMSRRFPAEVVFFFLYKNTGSTVRVQREER